MANTQVPDKAACFRFMCEMEMMEHIAEHSVMVQRVALAIVDASAESGIYLDRPLVRAAALLHDITKTRSIRTREDHARTGMEHMVGRGYPEVGDIIGQHVRLRDYRPNGKPTPAEVVNYADKRVLHDQVVSLERRMTYILERYGDLPDLHQKLDWMRKRSSELERKLFRNVRFPPERIAEHLPPEAAAADMAEYRRIRSGFSSDPLKEDGNRREK